MYRNLNKINILIVGGATGGHIYPGIAVAKEFENYGNIRLIMVITQKAKDIDIVSRENFSYRTLPLTSMKWNQILKAIWASWIIISEEKPKLVIGFGAYVSFPLLTVATLRRIPICIQEQNLYPGLANRIFARIAEKVFISFKESKKYFPLSKTHLVGNPIRQVTKLNKSEKIDQFNRMGIFSDRFTLLVSGGSLGAHSINQAMIDAISLLKTNFAKHLDDIQIIHQTGDKDYIDVYRQYKDCKVVSVIKPFFHNMMVLYSLADLIISRCGAGMIAEITAYGKPAILIPYPFAKGDHQKYNAMAMVNQGAAYMVEDHKLSGDILADKIINLIDQPERIKEMASSSKNMGHEDAAYKMASECIGYISKCIN